MLWIPSLASATFDPMSKSHWLVKQEPEAYPWDQFVADGGTAWTGVRNYQARINLRAMKTGDRVLFYHSGGERAVIGTCEVAKEAYPDPTSEDGDWVCVNLIPVKKLLTPVALACVKAEPSLANIALVRQSRLSVMPLGAEDFKKLVAMGGRKK
jgi:predicted RNA-binding protein with PUA-like domain